jgi:hypothetical protein
METATIREAVAVFDEPESLETAVSDLQSNGVDRAELSILAPPSPSDPDDAKRCAGNVAAPREAVVSDTDLRQGRVLGTSLAATIAGFAAAGITVATGGVAAATIAAAVVAAGGVGLAGTLIGRQLADEQTSFLDAQLARGGVLLWVRTRGDDAEKIVLDILRRHSRMVSIHDRPVGRSPAPASEHDRALRVLASQFANDEGRTRAPQPINSSGGRNHLTRR